MGVGKVMRHGRRAVFLDRDGVLNEVVLRDGRPYPPDCLNDMRLVPLAEECLEDLKRLGYLLIVVTNQPDVARGKQTQTAVEEVHAYLSSHLPIDNIYVCYHDDEDRCNCRKPAPGLLLKAAAKHGIELNRSFLIGDRWRDIEAGNAAGCRTLLIKKRYVEEQSRVSPTHEAESLRSAVDWIISHT